MIGLGACTMISLVASKPSMSGMCTSMVIRCGRSFLASSTASTPFFAWPTTRMSGSLSRTATSSSRTVSESSATTTRII